MPDEDQALNAHSAPEAASDHPAQPPHSTVIQERPIGSNSSGLVTALLLLVALIGSIYLFSGMGASERSKDDAVARAASDVGEAATKISEAADEATDTVSND